ILHVHTLSSLPFSFQSSPPHQHLHSFPTRRSSDLSPSTLSAIRYTSPGCLAPPEGLVLYGSRPNTFVGRYPWTPHVVCSSFETRSEEHTSELQSRGHLVCRLLLEKKKKKLSLRVKFMNAPHFVELLIRPQHLLDYFLMPALFGLLAY